MTEIQSILVADKSDHVAYLAHECRAERVGPNPLASTTAFEFLGLKTWRGNFFFRSGIDLERAPYSREFEMQIEVNVPKRASTIVPFDQLISDRAFNHGRRVFYHFQYLLDGQGYGIFAPVRYLNVGSVAGQKKRYVQPQSGYVCFEYEGNFWVGYLAIYVEENVVRGAQICYRHAIKTGSRISFTRRKIVNLFTSDFNRVLTLDHNSSKITFFRI